jgi:hypothetical protein
MNYICPISNLIIKPRQSVKFIFLRSVKGEFNMDHSFPYQSDQYFTPFGSVFDAKFVCNDLPDSRFEFKGDDKPSIVEKEFIDYINKNRISVEEVKEKAERDFFRFREESYAPVKTLIQLFNQIMASAIHFEDGSHLTAMIIPKKVFDIVMDDSDSKRIHNEYSEALKSEEYKENALKKVNWLKQMRKRLEDEMDNNGTYTETVFKEVLHTEEYIESLLDKVKGFKDSDDPERVNIYNKKEKEYRSNLGKVVENYVDIKHPIDNAYIEKEIKEMGRLGFGNLEFNLFNDLRTIAIGNSKNKLGKIILSDSVVNKDKKADINRTIDCFILEYFFSSCGLSFRPNQRVCMYSTSNIKGLMPRFYK